METLNAIIYRSGVQLIQLIPYVLAGSLLGAVLQRWKISRLVKLLKTLPSFPLLFGASFLGVLSPFCTIGTVPVVIGLIANGLPSGGGIAYLAASSMASPQMLLIQYGTLGPVFSILQGISAVGIGCLVGGIALLCEKREWSVMNPTSPIKAKHLDQQINSGLLRLFIDQFEFILIYMLVGVLLSSVIAVCGGESLFDSSAKISPSLSVLIGVMLSVPLYVCGGSAMPVLATMVDQGLPPGVALAFIIAGPATRLPVLAALKSIMNKKAFVGYIVIILAWSFLIGMTLNLWL